MIDYAQVPSVEPDLSCYEVLRRRGDPDKYTCLKYIKNEYLNSKVFNAIPGVSLVGQSKVTRKWGLIRVWGYMDAL